MKPFSMPELPPVFADLQRRMTELVGSGGGADFQSQLRQALESALQRLDLVTREEFSQQQRLLAQAQEKIATLEALLAQKYAESAGSSGPDGPSSSRGLHGSLSSDPDADQGPAR